MILAFEIIGMLILIIEVVATSSNIRTRKFDGRNQRWGKYYLWAWIIGIPLVALSVFIWYPTKGIHGQNYRIYGMPFVACVFDEKGADYVGIMTPVFMAANAIVWLLFPQLFVWVWDIISRKRSVAKNGLTNASRGTRD